MVSPRSNLALLIAAGAIILIGGGFLVWAKLATAPIAVPCTQEAKICPDGSSVGRVGPKCEFAACPAAKPLEITIYCTNNNCQPQQVMAGAGTLIRGCYRDVNECQAASSTCTSPEGCGTATSSLKTKIDSQQNIEFQYSEKLPTTYIQAQAWPPTVTVTAGVWSCKPTASSSSPIAPQIEQKAIAGQEYCIRTSSEGAAGSVYTTYGYTTVKEGRLVSIDFVLRAPQCVNYDEPQKSACTTERQAFNPDSLVEPIIASLKFGQNKSDIIKVETPQANQAIKSPLIIKGQARGNWYFEAVFPIKLYDGTGKEIGSTQGRALSDWTTTNFVPFDATMTFKTPSTATGTLVLRKDNPSGLPANDDKIEMPVVFEGVK